jgi:hypothetical protein
MQLEELRIYLTDDIPFLDVRFNLNIHKSLSTDIYYKETDTHNYVPFFSFYLHKTLSNIPYTLARHICTVLLFLRQ